MASYEDLLPVVRSSVGDLSPDEYAIYYGMATGVANLGFEAEPSPFDARAAGEGPHDLSNEARAVRPGTKRSHARADQEIFVRHLPSGRASASERPSIAPAARPADTGRCPLR